MNRKEHLLVILSEECSEVIKEVSKALRFGLENGYPGQSKTNQDNIEDELTDVFAVVEMLLDDGMLQTGKLKTSTMSHEKYMT